MQILYRLIILRKYHLFHQMTDHSTQYICRISVNLKQLHIRESESREMKWIFKEGCFHEKKNVELKLKIVDKKIVKSWQDTERVFQRILSLLAEEGERKSDFELWLYHYNLFFTFRCQCYLHWLTNFNYLFLILAGNLHFKLGISLNFTLFTVFFVKATVRLAWSAQPCGWVKWVADQLNWTDEQGLDCFAGP